MTVPSETVQVLNSLAAYNIMAGRSNDALALLSLSEIVDPECETTRLIRRKALLNAGLFDDVLAEIARGGAEVSDDTPRKSTIYALLGSGRIREALGLYRQTADIPQ